MKPASCTTVSLFIVILSKNSFFICFLRFLPPYWQRSFSKADAKVDIYLTHTKLFCEKYAEKHVISRFFTKEMHV